MTKTEFARNFRGRFRIDGDGDFMVLDSSDVSAKMMPTVIYDRIYNIGRFSLDEEDKWLAKPPVTFDRLSPIV